MRNPIHNFTTARPWYAAFTLAAMVSLTALAAETPRQVISLDGTWQIAEGSLDKPPPEFNRTVAVPGLADLAARTVAERG